MSKMFRIRLTIRRETTPQLFNDLEKIKVARHRAERLRLLAQSALQPSQTGTVAIHEFTNNVGVAAIIPNPSNAGRDPYDGLGSDIAELYATGSG